MELVYIVSIMDGINGISFRNSSIIGGISFHNFLDIMDMGIRTLQIYSYNLLPQLAVESKTVSSFQGTLQKALRHVSDMGIREWPRLLSQGARDLSVDRFQACFRR